MYSSSPQQGERFFTRLLLTIRPGITSFEELRTTNNDGVITIHETCRLACEALGLLKNDRYWHLTFEEAVLHQMPQQLRNLFIVAVTLGDLAYPRDIWDHFNEQMCDGIFRHTDIDVDLLPLALQNPHLDYGLYLISRELAQQNVTLQSYGLPEIVHEWAAVNHQNSLINLEISYDELEQETNSNTNRNQLNPEQLLIFDTITACIEAQTLNSCFFIQGPGVTGKTFLERTLAAYYLL